MRSIESTRITVKNSLGGMEYHYGMLNYGHDLTVRPVQSNYEVWLQHFLYLQMRLPLTGSVDN